MEILSLTPTVKRAIWGGEKLRKDWDYRTDVDRPAEAWLLSCHPDGPSIVKNGKYAGRTLSEALSAEGKAVLGTHNADKPDFPVLIKLIDAKEKLSVQVHPDDDYARRVEHENGKTEAWLVLEADPGAALVYGVNAPIEKADFRRHIEENTLEQTLNFVPVKAGDVAFIPAGTLHAIGGGILIAEVQQSSNTTYRVYDYHRQEPDGTYRPLHIDKALDVVDLTVPTRSFAPAGVPTPVGDAQKTLLTACEFFSMTEVKLEGEYADTADATSFVSLLVLEGEGELECGDEFLPLHKGDSIFIPAAKGAYEVKGSLRLLETRT